LNRYFRAIGFLAPLKRSDINGIVAGGLQNAEYRAYTTNDEDENSILAQYEIPFGSRFGISICGQFDEKDQFYPEYCYPYVDADQISSSEEIKVESKIESNTFSGVCEDGRVGVTLIYSLRNSIEYIKNSHINFEPLQEAQTSLTALALKGTILLPIYKTKEDLQRQEEQREQKIKWIQEARNGDEHAAHELTAMDMDVYSGVMSHIQTEDVYTIVDSYLMPSGAECELYSLLGEIRKLEYETNRLTGNEVVIMTVDCNGLLMDVAVSKVDLTGEPQVGRRFRGTVWMQGKIMFA
jgi:hypothetical protein